MTSFFVEGLKE